MFPNNLTESQNKSQEYLQEYKNIQHSVGKLTMPAIYNLWQIIDQSIGGYIDWNQPRMV